MNTNDPKTPQNSPSSAQPGKADEPIKPNPSTLSNNSSIDKEEIPLSSEDRNETFEENVKENLKDARDSKIKDLYDYTNYTTEQLLTYTLLILGLFLLFINNFFGGLLLGMVAGYYFANDIVYYLRNIGKILGGHDHLRYVTLTALLVGLIISVPGIFIGAVVVAAIKQVIEGKSHDHTDYPDDSKKL